MKLVDLDRLKWPNIAIFNMNLHGECVPMVRVSDLQALTPLGDVVPIEWLESHATEYYEDWGETPVTVENALHVWQKEQEAGR